MLGLPAYIKQFNLSTKELGQDLLNLRDAYAKGESTEEWIHLVLSSLQLCFSQLAMIAAHCVEYDIRIETCYDALKTIRVDLPVLYTTPVSGPLSFDVEYLTLCEQYKAMARQSAARNKAQLNDAIVVIRVLCYIKACESIPYILSNPHNTSTMLVLKCTYAAKSTLAKLHENLVRFA